MDDTKLIKRVLKDLRKKRQNILDGNINSIPSPFKRFSDDFIGIEQSTYYCITSITKGGKSQFTSFTFIYQPLLFAYYNPDKLKLKIFYFNLEETQERVTERFMCYILHHLSKGKIRIAPKDLRSTKNDKPLDENILELLESEEYANILEFFESTIIFSSTSNPTGIYKECKKYAEDNGTVHYKKSIYKDDLGTMQEIDKFDWYESADPKEYRLILIDHIGLIDTERGMSLKLSMDKLSEYLAKYLRNRYAFSPVVIQQQSFENESNSNFVSNKIRPSAQGLGDSKYISRDCNILLGLFSPFKFELKDYLEYDITIFKDNIRFLEIIANRDGEMGGICPLFFDGAVSFFSELPKPTDKEGIRNIYYFIQKLNKAKTDSISFMLLNTKIKTSGFKKSLIKKIKKYGTLLYNSRS